MTENQLRQKVVKIAVSYLGCKEADGSHRKIIDLYNSHKPLARGYAVKYTDAWCSTFASAVAIAAGLTDIIPTECGCEKHIALFKKLGAWVENDAYVPKPGDYIFYDWQDGTNYATTDNTGAADHVGLSLIHISGSYPTRPPPIIVLRPAPRPAILRFRSARYTAPSPGRCPPPAQWRRTA